jgi:hypothetical protein
VTVAVALHAQAPRCSSISALELLYTDNLRRFSLHSRLSALSCLSCAAFLSLATPVAKLALVLQDTDLWLASCGN